MSRCGNCRNQLCACNVIADCDAETGHCAQVIGTGATYAPIQARLERPAYRWIGSAHRTTQQVLDFGDAPIIFQESGVPITAGNMWSPLAPTRLTAQEPGLYLMSGAAAQSATNGTTQWEVALVFNGDVARNGLARKVAFVQNAAGGQILYSSVTTLARLNAGDYVELWIRTTLNFSTESTAPPHISAQWMAA